MDRGRPGPSALEELRGVFDRDRVYLEVSEHEAPGIDLVEHQLVASWCEPPPRRREPLDESAEPGCADDSERRPAGVARIAQREQQCRDISAVVGVVVRQQDGVELPELSSTHHVRPSSTGLV